tara:strand:- start:933 stop:2228 length:1296 start_codon:yes stop_codon:yes gene_type:complete
MDFIQIKRAMDIGQGKVSIRGWVHRERKSKKLAFIILRDSSEIIQCVFEISKFESRWKEIDKILIETSMEITGEIKKDERAPSGYEIQVDDFKVIHYAEVFPIKGGESEGFLGDMRHLWLRSQKMTSILKIRSTVVAAIHKYFRQQEFYEFHTPIFQAVQCEGGSTLFKVPYYGQKGVFLGQTWQLYAEPGIFALEKIYTVEPAFRAEKSKTSRHLTEIWIAEMEMAWSVFKDIQDHCEALIKYVVKYVLKKHRKELEILKRDITCLEASIKKPFIRMSYDEALKILKEKCSMDVEWGKDLRTLEEEKLTKLYDVPIIVTDYPKIVKAFYMKESPGKPKCVQGCDVLAPEGYGEIVGGSQREEDIEKIKQRLVETGEDPKEYEFYLDTRKYGSVPHGGFGLGVERIIAWICGLEHIKDAIAFPRTMSRFKP